jgi:hypothetical protein
MLGMGRWFYNGKNIHIHNGFSAVIEKKFRGCQKKHTPAFDGMGSSGEMKFTRQMAFDVPYYSAWPTITGTFQCTYMCKVQERDARMSVATVYLACTRSLKIDSNNEVIPFTS